MAFTPMRRDSGASKNYLTATSTTITKNQALVFSSGYVTPATSSATEIVIVANQALVTAGTHLTIRCINNYAANINYHALTNITPVQGTHVGNKYDLTDGNTVNLSFSTNAVFLVTGIVDATNKIVTGYFVKKAT